ncbi:integrase catalytic domain-containing protein [Trichonephila inaurata madagascariensis]|uniref:Integrase catalytic domain-containing protein n=1 Tax=Trichonephila inaurata madagascariensis TaxID=2747483 RepID=A0A8X6X3Y5_9ARAC|nr:integrase catalytic domain-containing protein [Trichonephila inaurata madagascariensis]
MFTRSRATGLERCRNAHPTSEGQGSGRTLDGLMTFLRKEVESEEMILLARTGLGSTQRQKNKATAEEPSLATSATLVNTKGERLGKLKFCLFCSQYNHWSSDWAICEIKEKGIIVPDLCNSVNEIDMLLGADVISVILSGRIIKFMSGLIAIGTMLGFTLMGKSSQVVNDNTEVSVSATRERQLSMFLNQLNIKELWYIETIGIRDPVENIKSEIQHSDMIERLQKDIKILPGGRYEEALPFKIEGQLRDNRGLTLKRLKRTCKKMGEKNSLKEYTSIFDKWEALKIVEKVTETEIETDAYYLPHKAVFRISETTKIRSVFDATARQGNIPSLNDCLLRGPNLIELIPDILNGFPYWWYVPSIGLSADIKNAFLQISVTPEHRDFLRFFYPHENNEIVYRHCRLVFGVCSIPFLLAASINHLLDNTKAI